MKRFLQWLISSFSLVILLAQPFGGTVYAVDPFSKTCTSGSSAAGSKFCQNVTSEAGSDRILGPNGIITKVTQIVVLLTGAISVIMIIIGGLRYILSAGDGNATKAAKDTVLYAVVGLVVAIFAQILVSFVLSKL